MAATAELQQQNFGAVAVKADMVKESEFPTQDGLFVGCIVFASI
jgi:hypothetical protein